MIKPKTKPKKKPPADDDAEPTPTVVPTSAFSIGDAVHHPMFGPAQEPLRWAQDSREGSYRAILSIGT
jgi:hypothetical protein